jgi:hypothetical protein
MDFVKLSGMTVGSRRSGAVSGRAMMGAKARTSAQLVELDVVAAGGGVDGGQAADGPGADDNGLLRALLRGHSVREPLMVGGWEGEDEVFILPVAVGK